MRDIPQMYHNYKKITTPDELSLVDFVGDYLLQGKEIFGHNKHDKSENPVTNTQFRHQANSPHVLLAIFFFSEIKTAGNKNAYNKGNKPFVIAGYTNELLRPPLSWSFSSLFN